MKKIHFARKTEITQFYGKTFTTFCGREFEFGKHEYNRDPDKVTCLICQNRMMVFQITSIPPI